MTMHTVMQVCREINMTYQTLKFYCNEGLVPNVKRDKNNRRSFMMKFFPGKDRMVVIWYRQANC